MANILNGGDNNDDAVYVYTGGRVPRDIRRAKIDESIDIILAGAFQDCEQLIEVEGHKKLKKIEAETFMRCRSLRRVMKMNGVIEIENGAFLGCHVLSDLEFDKLEIVGVSLFAYCKSLRSINLPSVRRVGVCAFNNCTALTEAAFGEDLEIFESYAFNVCTALRRIAIPLKDGLIIEDDAFNLCKNLSRVDIVGGIHEAISSLHMKSWRDEMKEEIDRINQTLPDTTSVVKTATIQQWIISAINRMENYKADHQLLLKEAMTLLELALWKARLEENRSNIDAESVEVVRKEHRVTCGASIVIKNVLPYLVLK